MFQAFLLVVIWLVVGSLTFGIGLIAIPIAYWLIVFRGADARSEKARKKLQSTLMKDEKVIATAVQNRIAALLVRRELVAITSSRFITIDRSWFGGFTMRDHQWKDLRDAKLEENILPNLFGSNIAFRVGLGAIRIKNIPSGIASEIYSHAQAEEQAWEEKRRIRALEESRAASGGVTIHSGAVGADGRSGGGTSSILDELGKAKALFDAGAISDAEYHEIKAKVLARA